MDRLEGLGLSRAAARDLAPLLSEGLIPARVAVQHRGVYEVLAEERDLLAEVSGRFRHQAVRTSDYPVVGDWVVARPVSGEDRAIIEAVLPRRTRVSRTDPAETAPEQVLAANVDTVFICSSADSRRAVTLDTDLR